MNDRREFRELLTRLFEEGLSHEEQVRLSHWLETDGEARSFYDQYVSVHAMLQWQFAPQTLMPAAAEPVLTPLSQWERGTRISPSPLAPLPIGKKGIRRWQWWMVATAASLLIAVAGLFWLQGPVAASPVARLDQVAGEVFVVERDVEYPAKAGQELFPGQSLRTGEESLAELILYDEANSPARLRVGSETTLNQLSPRRVFMTEGDLLEADVPKRAVEQSLVLATDHREFHLNSSRVSLSRTPEWTAIEVLAGKPVRAMRKDGQENEIPAGYSAEASNEETQFVANELAPRFAEAKLTIARHHKAIGFSSDSQTLAVAPWERQVGLWDSSTGKALGGVALPDRSGTWCLAYSPDGKKLALGGNKGQVNLWNLATQSWQILEGLPGSVRGLAFSSDGKTLAALSREFHYTVQKRTLAVWELATGKLLLQPTVIPAQVWAFSPDGQTLATSWDGRKQAVTFWNVRNGRQKRVLRLNDEYQRKPISALAYSADGQSLAVAAWAIVTVWGLEQDELLRTLHVPRGMVQAMAFSPDGRRLAVGVKDATVRIWDLPTTTRVATLVGHNCRVRFLAFSPDGRHLVTSSGQHRHSLLKLWSVPFGNQEANRNLPPTHDNLFAAELTRIQPYQWQ